MLSHLKSLNWNGFRLYPPTNKNNRSNLSRTWEHGGFLKDKITGKLLTQYTICSRCGSKLSYHGSPSCLQQHMIKIHGVPNEDFEKKALDHKKPKTRTALKLHLPPQKLLRGEIDCSQCDKKISFTRCAKIEINKHLTSNHMSEYLETSEYYRIEEIENLSLEKCLNWNGFRLYPPPNQCNRSSLSRTWEHGGFFKDQITGKLLTRYTICSRCGSKLSYHGSPGGLQQHMIKIHGVPNEDFEKKALEFIGCPDCDKIFETKNAFQDHQCLGEFKISGGEASNQIITCPYCPYFKQSLKNLPAHLYHKHKALSNTEQFQSLTSQLKQLTKDNCFCVECDKILQSKNSYKAHLKACHDPKIIECDVCRKIFSTLTKLKEHKYTHSERTIPCYQCGKLFKTERKMREHIRGNHSERKYVCEICSKRFKVPYLLEKHKRAVHEKLKPFSCEVCEFRCAAFPNLNLHRKKSHGCSPLRPTDYRDLVSSGKHPFVFSFPSFF